MEACNIADRDHVLASWSSLDEVTIIRSVVSEGKENIDLCIAYCCRKLEMNSIVYSKRFNSIVKDYVFELLQVHHLVQRAVEVLQNVGINVAIFLYQFLKQCDNEYLCTVILDYLAREYSNIYPQLIKSLQFHWDVMEQLRPTEYDSAILTENEKFLENNSVEEFIDMDVESKKPLLIELYLSKGDDRLLMYIDKFTLWKHLITFKRIPELTRWCWQSLLPKDDLNPETTALNCKDNFTYSYQMWPIDSEMYHYGVHHLYDLHNDALRNCFAAAGYFFLEETIVQQLQRIAMTNSFQKNIEKLSKASLSYYIWSSKSYHLLLKDFVSIEELQQVVHQIPEEKSKLQLVEYLKKHSLHNLDGFQMV